MALKEKKIYPKWLVTIKNNKVVFQDRETFDRHLIPMEGKQKHLIIKDIVKERSRQEEKYYRAVVVTMVAEAMDIPAHEAHELLKKMFLSVEEKSSAGYRYTRIQSTTELSDKAYRAYWGECIKWASLPTLEDGIGPDSGLEMYIPLPNETDWENY